MQTSPVHAAAAPAAATDSPDAAEDRRRRRIIAAWLFAVCAMVFLMVILGGVTRLTHSGLSMVHWQPLTRWLPPFGDAAWQAAFDQYKRFPEYQKLNLGMTLAGFKSIFWLEFLHRLWGRLIGVAFLVPFVVFVARRWVDRALGWKLAGLFVLGGLQGLLGWYMVKSGLVDHPDVSQYRLTAHLISALVILGAMFWVALDLLDADRPAAGAAAGRLRPVSVAIVVLVLLTIASGGFVAGLDAGFGYNTFPLMEGKLIPDGLYPLHPFFVSAFEDAKTVQFDHRVLATLTFCTVIGFWLAARRHALPRPARLAVNALAAAVVLQVTLGISTLLLVVPVPLAAAHQANAMLLYGSALWTVHALRPAARRVAPS